MAHLFLSFVRSFVRSFFLSFFLSEVFGYNIETMLSHVETPESRVRIMLGAVHFGPNVNKTLKSNSQRFVSEETDFASITVQYRVVSLWSSAF